LKAQGTGQAAIDLFAKSQKEFYAKVAPIQVMFNIGENAMAESLTLFQGGMEIEAKRVKE